MLSRSPRLRFLALFLLGGAAFLTRPASADVAAGMSCSYCSSTRDLCLLSDPIQHSLCGAYCGAGRIALSCGPRDGYMSCIRCSDDLLPPT